MASRRCACGAELEEVASRLHCPSCGAHAGAWLVVTASGAVVAAGNPDGVCLGPALAQFVQDLGKPCA